MDLSDDRERFMRIAIAGLQHETNTFAPEITEADAFFAPGGWPAHVRGAAMIPAIANTSVPTAGALQVLDKAGGTPVPLLWAMALPSGPVRHSAFVELADDLLMRLRDAMPVDGVFIELHGAMATTADDDAEGALLARVRELVGPDVPVVAALDLHTNLSTRMVEATDQLFAYLTYPHVDMADTGARAMRQLLAFVKGAPRPAKAFRQMPFLLPLVAQNTGSDPVNRIYAQAARGDAETMLTLGFPLADVPDSGPALTSYGSDQATADRVADDTLRHWIAAEPEFDTTLSDPADAITRAMRAKRGPVVLADVQDNPGGGGSNDTTGLLSALVQAGASGALLVHIADAGAVAAALEAGEGGTIDVAVGGKTDPHTGAPVAGPWKVLALNDGPFTGSGPMYKGNAIDMGPVALLEQNGVRVIVAGKRMQASEPSLIRHLGLEPADIPILCVKSSVHFRGAYEEMATEIILVAAPGRVIMDLNALDYKKSRRRAAGLNPKP